MADRPETLALDESVRAMAHQKATLDGLRTRAGTLVAAASIATSFLGGDAIASVDDSWSTALGVVLFVVVLACMIAILWPRRWDFTVSANTILGNQRRVPADIATHEVWVAQTLEAHFDANQVQLNQLMRLFRWGCIALTAETVAWFLPI
jgi:hypothetical protein